MHDECLLASIVFIKICNNNGINNIGLKKINKIYEENKVYKEHYCAIDQYRNIYDIGTEIDIQLNTNKFERSFKLDTNTYGYYCIDNTDEKKFNYIMFKLWFLRNDFLTDIDVLNLYKNCKFDYLIGLSNIIVSSCQQN
jgi:hypothetical protein